MSFKDMVGEDIANVFLNTDEFAETHTVKYDGRVYEDIPIVLTKAKEMKRPVTVNDHAEGIHKVTVTAHISLADLNGVIPEQKQVISIDDGEALGKPFFRRYTILTSDCEMRMVVLELEAFDE